jgi:hydrogenase expression/formation protein HypC
MCLGVPGRIVRIEGGDLRFGTVAFGGVNKSVCLACVPDAGLGDYVVVHAGFAIARIDEAEAERTLALIAELGEGDEPAPPEDGR